MSQQTKGWQGKVLTLMGGSDVRLTVTETREISPHYRRVSVSAGGLFDRKAVHPTMWLRLWFPPEDPTSTLHHRAYTVVNPDPAHDAFDLEFALHDGLAARWGRDARVGDTIDATFQGSKYAVPDPLPAGYLIAGDTASLPAVNSLLSAIPENLPATVWLETVHDDDRALPVAAGPATDVRYVPRRGGGASMIEAVREGIFDASGHAAWVACDTVTTRAIVSILKADYRIARRSIKAQGYWIA
ncbi:MAG: siderophore-interacting protein [Rhodococcus sp. (in: high G+C Gram-positive bacteria)]